MASNKPKRIWLISYPRTASNLLVRIFNLDEQPNVLSNGENGYFFRLARILTEELKVRVLPVNQWPEESKKRLMATYQDCFDQLYNYTESGATQSKIIFFKEHPYFAIDPAAQSRFITGENPPTEALWRTSMPGKERARNAHPGNVTVMPDEFVRGLAPIFLIRHPGMAFPSFYRTYKDLEEIDKGFTEEVEIEISLVISLTWSRRLYEWYKSYSHQGYYEDPTVTEPIILDADDYISNPSLLSRVSELVGLDPSKLRFTWDTEDGENCSATKRRMQSTLFSSNGLITSKSSAGFDIEREAIKWKEEFGDLGGATVEKWVRDAMEDYEFLRERRLRPENNTK